MTLVVPDDVLQQSGLTERQFQIECACRLFDAGTLALWPAARCAGLSRAEFEAELRRRGIDVYRPTIADLDADADAVKALGI